MQVDHSAVLSIKLWRPCRDIYVTTLRLSTKNGQYEEVTILEPRLILLNTFRHLLWPISLMSLSILKTPTSSKTLLYCVIPDMMSNFSSQPHFLNSIIAIHGLNPTNKEFHARQTWTSNESKKLWLSDSEFLPKSFPRARIMLFGYNSNVAFQTSKAGVREQAGNLLNRVNIERRVIPLKF